MARFIVDVDNELMDELVETICEKDEFLSASPVNAKKIIIQHWKDKMKARRRRLQKHPNASDIDGGIS